MNKTLHRDNISINLEIVSTSECGKTKYECKIRNQGCLILVEKDIHEVAGGERK